MLTGLLNFPRFPQAKCVGDIADSFFPESKAELAESLPTLRSICHSCVHEKECLKYALDNEIVHGFWGGKTTEERNLIAMTQPIEKKKETSRLDEVLHLQALGWSLEAIARSSSVSVASVSRLLNRARKKGHIK
jgi:WhiB family redox-sensing transcriptional regulator